MTVIIAIATLGQQANIDRLLNWNFWADCDKQNVIVHILSQIDPIRLKPKRGLIVDYSPAALGCGGARQKIVDYHMANGLKENDCIAFLDDDIEVCEIGWLEKLIAPLSQGFAISGVEGRKLSKKLPVIAPKNFDYVSGGWVAIKGEVFLNIPRCRFDPQFNPNYWEDVDICYQAKAKGLTIACVGDIGLSHVGELKPHTNALLQENRAKFYEKWGLK